MRPIKPITHNGRVLSVEESTCSRPGCRRKRAVSLTGRLFAECDQCRRYRQTKAAESVPVDRLCRARGCYLKAKIMGRCPDHHERALRRFRGRR